MESVFRIASVQIRNKKPALHMLQSAKETKTSHFLGHDLSTGFPLSQTSAPTVSADDPYSRNSQTLYSPSCRLRRRDARFQVIFNFWGVIGPLRRSLKLKKC